jgi:hypothetical protein
MANLGLLVGASLLVNVILGISGFFAPIGTVVNVIVGGPLYGGLFLVFLKTVRGHAAGVGDVFGGFGPSFVQLMLGQIVVGVLTALSGIVFIMGVVSMIVLHRMLPGLAMGLLCVVGIVPAIYLTVAWMFTLPLIIDKHMEFWPAMELSRLTANTHFWPLLGLLVLGSALVVAGFLVCVVGVLITFPIFFGLLAYAYEDLFGTGGVATA